MRTEEFRRLTEGLYDVISGPKGPRDWARLKRFYHKDARLVRVNGIPGERQNGAAEAIQVMTVDEYIENVTPFLLTGDFVETEIDHMAQRIGDTATVLSTFAAEKIDDDEVLRWTGVNLIHLVRADVDWLVMSIVWDSIHQQ